MSVCLLVSSLSLILPLFTSPDDGADGKVGSRKASGTDCGGRSAPEDPVSDHRPEWLEGLHRGGSIYA